MEQYQDQLPLRKNPVRWTFIWIVTTIFSIIAGYALIDALPEPINDFFSLHPNLSVFVFGIFWGAFVGFFQWLVLRVRAAQAVWWIPFNAAGYTLMLLGVHIIDEFTYNYWSDLMKIWYAEPDSAFYTIFHTIYGDIYLSYAGTIVGLSIVFGIALGITQWLSLRKLQPIPVENSDEASLVFEPPQPPRRIAAWWIPIHLLSTFLAGWMAVKASSGDVPITFFFILYGVISGIEFALFLRILLGKA